MILYPAVDLKRGECVRLEQGDMARTTVFGNDPALQVSHFEDAGCEWVHVVDLDGAFEGGSPNADAVSAILDSTSLKVQLGGGIRTEAAADAWLHRGVERIVLGTIAAKDPELAGRICAKHPDRVAIAADVRHGRIAVEGWANLTDLSVKDFAQRAVSLGAVVLIHTDISRDGTLSGVDPLAVSDVARASPLPVVASGGVSSYSDLEALKLREKDGIVGVVVGRAIYEGNIDVSEAAALLVA